MHHNIIKDTINLDKNAREQVQELKLEKENLGEAIKQESTKLQKQYKEEIKHTLKETKASLEKEVHLKQESELLSYDKTLVDIQKQYEANKEVWIEEIYKECIK
jgi:V/A-type H+/Na+-transporting ATPase subunit G/H